MIAIDAEGNGTASEPVGRDDDTALCETLATWPSTPGGGSGATLATRKAKGYGAPAEWLAAGWHARAERLGFDDAARDRLLGRTTPVPPSREVLARAATVLLGPGGLTERSPVFDLRDALRARCAQLPGGAPVDQVERLADTLLAEPDVVPVDRTDRDGVRPGAERSLARHTTTDMLATRQPFSTPRCPRAAPDAG